MKCLFIKKGFLLPVPCFCTLLAKYTKLNHFLPKAAEKEAKIEACEIGTVRKRYVF